jgi:small-conductance mechanosensitive channel/CRP-like cAMP-binding protein
MEWPVFIVASHTSVLSHPAVILALIAAPIIYLGGLAIGRLLKTKYGVPLGLIFRVFCLALACYAPLRVIFAVELHVYDPFEVWQTKGIGHFQAALMVLGAAVGLQLLRRFYWQRWFSKRHGAEAPKLLQQVFGFAVFCVALALVLKVTYGFQVDTFIAGSGIVAVVIGLAMQETLANIISGISLQISKPFRVGDWLILDNHRAEVVELNWRSTKLRTNDDVYLDLPNKTVVTHTITNLSYPTKVHANRIRISFDYGTPPNVVRELLVRAAASAPGVLEAPPTKVFLKEFGESGIIYEIKYCLDDERHFNDIEDAIRTNVWYAARRAGLAIPFPIRTVELRRPAHGSQTEAAPGRHVVTTQELFAPLDDGQKRRLLEGGRNLRFGRGENIIRQGAEGCSMFIIVQGEVEVIVHAAQRDTVVATLHAGEAFGEMCLLTGEKRSATVRAKSDCDIWEIERASIQPLLDENKGLAERLSDLLARHRMDTEGILAAQTPPQVVEQKRKEYAAGFRRKLSSLFGI